MLVLKFEYLSEAPRGPVNTKIAESRVFSIGLKWSLKVLRDHTLRIIGIEGTYHKLLRKTQEKIVKYFF